MEWHMAPGVLFRWLFSLENHIKWSHNGNVVCFYFVWFKRNIILWKSLISVIKKKCIDIIATKFCTCHNSIAVMVYAKYYSSVITLIAEKCYFHRIWILIVKPLVKQAPACLIPSSLTSENVLRLTLSSNTSRVTSYSSPLMPGNGLAAFCPEHCNRKTSRILYYHWWYYITEMEM